MKNAKLTEFIPDPRNANKGTVRGRGMLEKSLQALGAGRSVLADKHGVLIAGNKTLQTAVEAGFEDAIVVETDGTQLVVVKRTDLDLGKDDKAKQLAIADNRVGQISLEWDAAVLQELREDQVDLSGFFSDKELDKLIDALPSDPNLNDPEPPAEQPPVDAHLPALVFPTDNDWGIPLLLSSHQAEQFSTPFQPWGMKARGTTFEGGTLHFYIDDYRFAAVWNEPSKVVQALPYAVIEPNFTNSLESPKAYVLYNIFRKRWLSRYWQSQGLRIFVDLNVPVEFKDINFLGVPKDWRAFATRGYSDRLTAAQLEYESAVEFTGTTELLFLVYGGGKKVQAHCRERGWLWQPEQFDRVKGLVDG